MNLALAPLRAGRGGGARRARTPAVDAAIVLSAAAGFAHVVAAPGHLSWWPAAGVFFVVVGAAQLVCSVLLVGGRGGHRLALVGIWGTVGVMMLYVASRTVGLPWTPPVPFHGGRWVLGRSIMPDGAKHVGPLDVFTLVAEVLVVITLLTMLPNRVKRRTVNQLLWIGLALWGAAVVGLL